jgi:hypothetical protein
MGVVVLKTGLLDWIGVDSQNYLIAEMTALASSALFEVLTITLFLGSLAMASFKFHLNLSL